MIVSFHRLAALELKRAYRWYAKRSAFAAQRFQEAIAEALTQIEEGPEQWPKFRRFFRWLKTRRFPYVLYYEILDVEEIMIVAVVHGSRRPVYWLRRRKK